MLCYNETMFYEVVPTGRTEGLTYNYHDSLLHGQIVLVPVGKRAVPGVVIKKVAQPNFKTKSILKVLYSKPLPKHLISAMEFIHDYYLAPLGATVSLVLPKGVEKKRRKTEHLFGSNELNSGDKEYCPEPKQTSRRKTEQGLNFPEIRLNTAQKNALEGLQKAAGATKLLYGVTGSGKTHIYLEMAKKALRTQKSTIVLVPEIALTGQTVRVFRENFGDKIVLIHSKQTEAERHRIFEYILSSTEPMIVIGPRSALFAPLSNLGLIIIDEEHESSYFQENPPRYSAIRVASFLASKLDIPLILGSATPTVEDFYFAKKKDSAVLLTEKAKSEAKKPEIKIIDFKKRENFTKNRYFSNSLLETIERNLKNKRQTLIFHNRRGSAPLTICENCGEEILCPNCFLPLTLHADKYVLECHTCGYSERVPVSCPKCRAPGIIHKGFGTKLLESELKKLFPKARVRRFDADNKKGEGLEEVYDEVLSGEVDILVGTQTLAKGLDLPKLATVGVIQADAGLSLPDFAAEERTFQLLTQVIGRVGRGHTENAEVFIQTFRPEHPVLEYAKNEDYLGFSDYLLKKRRKTGFPPFAFIAKIELTMKTEAIVLKRIREVAKLFTDKTRFIVSAPSPAFHERTNKGYTWEIIVRARSRKALTEMIRKIDPSFKITLDPPGLL